MEDTFTPLFNRDARENWINTQDQDIYDVAIIGGGITGAGVVNILSENGVKVILLERNDFGSGTSSGSSKLIHGGLGKKIIPWTINDKKELNVLRTMNIDTFLSDRGCDLLREIEEN